MRIMSALVFFPSSVSPEISLPGLTVVLASIKPGETITGHNDVSVFDHHTSPKIMLGAVAFKLFMQRKLCVNEQFKTYPGTYSCHK